MAIKRKLSAEYIVGFVDGEGSFTWTRRQLKTGTVLRPVFNICNNNLDILMAIREYLHGAGWITKRQDRKSPNPNYIYTVKNYNEITEIIIPFFDEHPLIVKADDYNFFRKLATEWKPQKRIHVKGYWKKLEKSIVADYKRGLSWKEIITKYDISCPVLCKILERNKLRRRRDNSDLTKEFLKRYLDMGFSRHAIAKTLNIPQTTIYRYAKKYGLTEYKQRFGERS
jgi:transposase